MDSEQAHLQQTQEPTAYNLNHVPDSTGTSNGMATPVEPSLPLTRRLMILNTQAITHLWEGEEERSLALLSRGLQVARMTLQRQPAESQERQRQPLGTNSTDQQILQNPSVVISLSSLELTGVLHGEHQKCHGHASNPGETNSNSSNSGGFLYYGHVFLLEADRPLPVAQQSQDNITSFSLYGQRRNVQEVSPEEHPVPTSFVHNHNYQSPGINSSCSSVWTVGRVCALLAYNLAVVHHETGLATGSLVSLGQAAALYRLALVMMWKEQQQSQREQQSTTLSSHSDTEALAATSHLNLALYNNLGHVGAFLDDAVTVQVSRQGLEMTLHREQQRRQEEDVPITSRNGIVANRGGPDTNSLGASAEQEDHGWYHDSLASDSHITWQSCLDFFQGSLQRASRQGFLQPCAPAA